MLELRGSRYQGDHTKFVERVIRDDLRTWDLDEVADFYHGFSKDLAAAVESGAYSARQANDCRALLGCNDRFYLLTDLLHRQDLRHPWLFERCREVEAEPDGYMDMWARGHYKSTIITFGGIIQDILVDPNVKIAIFSVVKPIAQAFLGQIKDEFEQNEDLKIIYADVLYANPRHKDPDGSKPAKWGLARGITVRRKSNPKEATLEAHGLLDGQPTSRHYDKMNFDDIVTQDYTAEDQIRKTTQRLEMADNLGTHNGCAKRLAGTYYNFNDTHVQMRDRGSFKVRVYPATHNGKLDGIPVLMPPGEWEKKKRDQRSTIACQMLLDPSAAGDSTFNPLWLRNFEAFPTPMNVYIMCDPSKGSGERSDRTAIAVVGIDKGGNKYLIDGYRHRMKLSDRYDRICELRRKWMDHRGVVQVSVGYEQYGMQCDIEVIKEYMDRDKQWFEIIELGTPRQGGHSKKDRIERLEPDVRQGIFHFPVMCWNPDKGGDAYWRIWTEEHVRIAEAIGKASEYSVGEIAWRPALGPSKRCQDLIKTGQSYRVVQPIKRRDEKGDIYDLTRTCFEELIRHPFGGHDDLIDVLSRIYDMQAQPPLSVDAGACESLEAVFDDDTGMWGIE